MDRGTCRRLAIGLFPLLLMACGAGEVGENAKVAAHPQPSDLYQQDWTLTQIVADGVGGFVIAGYERRADQIILTAYRADASLRFDSLFAEDGRFEYALPAGQELSRQRLMLDRQGRLLMLVGSYSTPPSGGGAVAVLDSFLLRVTGAGELDRQFGRDGRASAPLELLPATQQYWDLQVDDQGYWVSGVNLEAVRSPSLAPSMLRPPATGAVRSFGYVLRLDDLGNPVTGFGRMGLAELPAPGGGFALMTPESTGRLAVVHQEIRDDGEAVVYLSRLDGGGDAIPFEDGSTAHALVERDPLPQYTHFLPRELNLGSAGSLLIHGCDMNFGGAEDEFRSAASLRVFSGTGEALQRILVVQPNESSGERQPCINAVAADHGVGQVVAVGPSWLPGGSTLRRVSTNSEVNADVSDLLPAGALVYDLEVVGGRIVGVGSIGSTPAVFELGG